MVIKVKRVEDSWKVVNGARRFEAKLDVLGEVTAIDIETGNGVKFMKNEGGEIIAEVVTSFSATRH